MDDVLYDYDWRVRMAGLTELTGHDLDELRRRWWNAGGEWAAEAGEYRDADALSRGVRQGGRRRHHRSSSGSPTAAAAMTPWPDSIAAVARAAELGQVSPAHQQRTAPRARTSREHRPEIAPLFGEHLRTSSYYGARKPNRVVFQRLLDEYDADPADVFFTDDLPENVRGAESRRHHRAPVHDARGADGCGGGVRRRARSAAAGLTSGSAPARPCRSRMCRTRSTRDADSRVG